MSGYQWEGGGFMERVKEGEQGGSILRSMYENKTMKSVEIVLRRGARGQRRKVEGMYLILRYM
jgi:phage terminase large subunit-like protein